MIQSIFIAVVVHKGFAAFSLGSSLIASGCWEAGRRKWFAALAEQEGGEDAATALMAEYRSLVDESEVDVGHYHAPMEDE